MAGGRARTIICGCGVHNFDGRGTAGTRRRVSRGCLRVQEVHDQEDWDESSGEVPCHCLSSACAMRFWGRAGEVLMCSVLRLDVAMA
jgi:hypothetical protein